MLNLDTFKLLIRPPTFLLAFNSTVLNFFSIAMIRVFWHLEPIDFWHPLMTVNIFFYLTS